MTQIVIYFTEVLHTNRYQASGGKTEGVRDFRESFQGLRRKKKKGREARREEKGKINWQKSLQTLPETETSAQAGSTQTLTQSGHKLKLKGFNSGSCSAVKLC